MRGSPLVLILACAGSACSRSTELVSSLDDGGRSVGDAPEVGDAGVDATSSMDASADTTRPVDASTDALSDAAPNFRFLDADLPGVCADDDPCAVVQLSAGPRHNCAVQRNGDVVCWGGNLDGQLGTDTVEQSPLPRKVAGLPPVRAVVAGELESCAISLEDEVYCWGVGTSQLGRYYTNETPPHLPDRVDGLEEAARTLDVGRAAGCVVTALGTVVCWGNIPGLPGRPNGGAASIPGLSAVQRVSVGSRHACVLREDGVALCWGENRYGQLGLPETVESSLEPAPIPGARAAVAVEAGGYGTCLAHQDGTVWCVGYSHRLDGEPRWTLAQLSELSDVESLDFPIADHACARTHEGVTRCWGRNYWGQLGRGTAEDSTLGPGDATLLVNFASVGTGGVHGCALDGRNRVWCWGNNQLGQFGNGSADDVVHPIPTPSLVVE